MLNSKFLKIAEEFDLKKYKKIAIAFSGGIDSMALLMLLNFWHQNLDNSSPSPSQDKPELYAIIVDHNLRKESASEAKDAISIAKQYVTKLNTVILEWQQGQYITKNIEASARTARYKLITDYCKKEGIELLLTGHNADEQIETFIMRLMRASGLSGLSSIRAVIEYDQIKIIRPLLNVNKSELKNFLINNNIKWVEDQSNSDMRFLRNQIRKCLSSKELAQIWHKDYATARILDVISHIKRAENFISQETSQIFNKLVVYDDKEQTYRLDQRQFITLHEEIGIRLIKKILSSIHLDNENIRFHKLYFLYLKINNQDLAGGVTLGKCKIYNGHQKNKKNLIFFKDELC